MIPSPDIWNFQNKHPFAFLLLENGGHILQEDSGKLLLDQSGASVSLWTNETLH